MPYNITPSRKRSVPSLLTMLRLESDFLDSEADKLFSYCLSLESWEQKNISIFGKKIPLARLVAAYSDCQDSYAYSRIKHDNNPLTYTFSNLLTRVSSHLNIEFNHLLLNYYRDGTNAVGWHSDNEKQLGNEINVAMLSLGVSRIFKVKHLPSKKITCFTLKHGSLLLMKHPFQVNWNHCLPKMPSVKDHRMSITFRKIIEKEEQ